MLPFIHLWFGAVPLVLQTQSSLPPAILILLELWVPLVLPILQPHPRMTGLQITKYRVINVSFRIHFKNVCLLKVNNSSNDDYRHLGHHHSHSNGGEMSVSHHTSDSPVTSQHMDLKPSSDQLMTSIGSLSAYTGIHSGRKVPEGTNTAYADTSPGSAYTYYPTGTELAMYGGSVYHGASRSSSSSLHSSRPKAKVRSNAGKIVL